MESDSAENALQRLHSAGRLVEEPPLLVGEHEVLHGQQLGQLLHGPARWRAGPRPSAGRPASAAPRPPVDTPCCVGDLAQGGQDAVARSPLYADAACARWESTCVPGRYLPVRKPLASAVVGQDADRPPVRGVPELVLEDGAAPSGCSASAAPRTGRRRAGRTSPAPRPAASPSSSTPRRSAPCPPAPARRTRSASPRAASSRRRSARSTGRSVGLQSRSEPLARRPDLRRGSGCSLSTGDALVATTTGRARRGRPATPRGPRSDAPVAVGLRGVDERRRRARGVDGTGPGRRGTTPRRPGPAEDVRRPGRGR